MSTTDTVAWPSMPVRVTVALAGFGKRVMWLPYTSSMPTSVVVNSYSFHPLPLTVTNGMNVEVSWMLVMTPAFIQPPCRLAQNRQ